MLADADVSTLDPVARTIDRTIDRTVDRKRDMSGVCSHERSVEAGVLLQAITALRHADILTVAEYEAKRQRLAAHL